MRPTRSQVIALVGTLILVAGCSSAGSSAATSAAPAAASQPAASPANASLPAAASPAVSAQPATGAGNGTLPGDPCKLVTAADVTRIYGGSVSQLPASDAKACSFEITGKALAGESAAGEFAVSFNGAWSSYDQAKVVFGDALKKVDGLGTDAYSYQGFIHTKVGSSDLVVGGVFVGTYDRAKLDQETFDMAKLVLSRV